MFEKEVIVGSKAVFKEVDGPEGFHLIYVTGDIYKFISETKFHCNLVSNEDFEKVKSALASGLIENLYEVMKDVTPYFAVNEDFEIWNNMKLFDPIPEGYKAMKAHIVGSDVFFIDDDGVVNNTSFYIEDSAIQCQKIDQYLKEDKSIFDEIFENSAKYDVVEKEISGTIKKMREYNMTQTFLKNCMDNIKSIDMSLTDFLIVLNENEKRERGFNYQS